MNIGRIKENNWKTSVLTSVIISNSCTTPNATIKKEMHTIFKELNIEENWINGKSIRLFYDVPWFELPL